MSFSGFQKFYLIAPQKFSTICVSWVVEFLEMSFFVVTSMLPDKLDCNEASSFAFI